MSAPARWRTRLAALAELGRMRLLYSFREPGVVFTSLFLPVLLTVILGFAFGRPPPELQVAVIPGPGSEELRAVLDQLEAIRAREMGLEAAQEKLSHGQLALVVVPGRPVEALFDARTADGRAARLWLDRVISDQAGLSRAEISERPLPVSRTRYVDFLVPGMLAYSLMASGLWQFSHVFAKMRADKLLKRLEATPMGRVNFLLSFALMRQLMALAEITLILLAARLVFGVESQGSVLQLLPFALLGATTFVLMSFIVGSRAVNHEQLNGWLFLLVSSMAFTSGVFFPLESFPEFVRQGLSWFPLPALTTGMRRIFLDGSGLGSVWREALILIGWGGLCLGLGHRLFRWK